MAGVPTAQGECADQVRGDGRRPRWATSEGGAGRFLPGLCRPPSPGPAACEGNLLLKGSCVHHSLNAEPRAPGAPAWAGACPGVLSGSLGSEQEAGGSRGPGQGPAPEAPVKEGTQPGHQQGPLLTVGAHPMLRRRRALCGEGPPVADQASDTNAHGTLPRPELRQPPSLRVGAALGQAASQLLAPQGACVGTAGSPAPRPPGHRSAQPGGANVLTPST